MNTIIYDNDKMPVYLQLFNQIIDAMKSGEYKEGERVPSEMEFCTKTQLARGTVRKAFDKLENEGYIKKIQGSGTYVLGWQPELRNMVLFAKKCSAVGLKPEKSYQLLKQACHRYFSEETIYTVAIIDCTPEIAEDIGKEVSEVGHFEIGYYEVANVRQGEQIPTEEVWITTRSHYEEVRPVAQAANKQLMMVTLEESIVGMENINSAILLGIVYDTQDFLMHVSHSLALLGLHNTCYLCQKEEWEEKKKAISKENIVWLISAREEKIIQQMGEMKSKYIVFGYHVVEGALTQLKSYVEKKNDGE